MDMKHKEVILSSLVGVALLVFGSSVVMANTKECYLGNESVLLHNKHCVTPTPTKVVSPIPTSEVVTPTSTPSATPTVTPSVTVTPTPTTSPVTVTNNNTVNNSTVTPTPSVQVPVGAPNTGRGGE